MPRKPKLITAPDLYKFQLITDAQISPDGSKVIFSVQRVNDKTEKKYTDLWLAPTGTGKLRQFTHGNWSDSQPRWSPDGSQIAFLSNRDDETQSQIYLIPVDGGEAKALTEFKDMTIADFAWSPDGKQFLSNIRKKDADAVERDANPDKKKLGVVARHYTSLIYKADGQGYLPQEKWHIWRIDAKSGKATQLTHGDHHEGDYDWSPDGKWITYFSNTSQKPDLSPEAYELYVMPATGKDPQAEARKIETMEGFKFLPRWSPDGSQIAFGYAGEPGNWMGNVTICVVPADGSAPPQNLTKTADLHCAAGSGSDTGGGNMSPYTWSRDGRKLYFQAQRQGDIRLMSVTVEDEPVVECILDEAGLIGSFTFDAKQEKLAYTWATQTHPAHLFVRDMGKANAKQLSRFNTNWLRRLDLGEIEEVWFEARDGYPLHGWILTPPGFDPAQKYPSILEIHGGPQTQYDKGMMHEFRFLAANGYVVYWSNPRGSQGYGAEHCETIRHRWGTVDLDDVLDWANFVGQKPYIDPNRKGVTGGSYGGYMTNMLIGREPDYFQAAVTQRSVFNLVSFWGTSDGNWNFQKTYGQDKPPYENLDTYWEQSPMKYIGNAKTPTLVIHSELDFRADKEQGEQLFVALRTQGVDTELVLFPGEPHGLSRSGRTDRRIMRLNHMLRWFDKYLK